MLQLQNNTHRYGLLASALHWIMAIMIIAVFFLGEYMVDLDYYDAWYQAAPDLHRSFGVIVAILFVIRLGWRLGNPRPVIIGRQWEQFTAIWVHRLFYILIAAIVISGYLITTADGQAVSVFNWFDLPASLQGFENQADVAGQVHEWLATIMILLVVLHTLAALKHHFINHDSTLRRISGMRDTNHNNSKQSKEKLS